MRIHARLYGMAFWGLLLATKGALAATTPPPDPPATDQCKPYLGATVCPIGVTLKTSTGATIPDYYGSVTASTNASFALPTKDSAFVRALMSLFDYESTKSVKIEMELVLASNGIGIRSLGKYSLVGFDLDKKGSTSNLSGQVTQFSPTVVTPSFPLRGGAQILVIFRTTFADTQKLSVSALLNKIKPLAAAVGGGEALLTAATPPAIAITDFIDQAIQSQDSRTVEYDTVINFDVGRQNKVTFELAPGGSQPSFKLTLEPTLSTSLTGITADPARGPVANPENNIFVADDKPRTLAEYLRLHGVPVKSLDFKPASDSSGDQKVTDSAEQACNDLYGALTTSVPLVEFDAQAVLHSRIERANLSAVALKSNCISRLNKTGGEWDTFGLGLISPADDGSIPNVTVDNAKDDLGKLAAALGVNNEDARKSTIADFVLPPGSHFTLTAPRELTPKGADDQALAPDGKRLQSVSPNFFAQIHSCALGDYFKRTDNAANQVSFLLLAENVAKTYVGTATYLKAADGGLLLSALDFHELDQNDYMKTKDGDRQVRTDGAAFLQTAFGQKKVVTDFLKSGTAPVCNGS